MKIILIFLLISSSCVTFSQVAPTSDSSFNELVFFVKSNNEKFQNAEGTRYLNDEFVLVAIDNISSNQFVRFNIAENAIEIKGKDDEINRLRIDQNYTFRLKNGSGRIFEIKSYKKDDGRIKKSFFEKVYENKSITLFLKERIKFIPAVPEKSSYEPAKPARFNKIEDAFYFKEVDSDVLIEIPRKKKQFYKLFEKKSKAIQELVKKERLSIDQKEGLIKIFEHYTKK